MIPFETMLAQARESIEQGARRRVGTVPPDHEMAERCVEAIRRVNALERDSSHGRGHPRTLAFLHIAQEIAKTDPQGLNPFVRDYILRRAISNSGASV